MGNDLRTKCALFLDRDGVINMDTGYPHRTADIVFIDGIFEFCRRAAALDLALVIATNQAGIARGYYAETDFWSLMEWMKGRFAEEGIEFLDVYHCPYHPQGIGQYRRVSEERKPAPGMLLRAMRDHALDLPRSFLIGDRESDIAAGKSAGLAGNILFAPDCRNSESLRVVSDADAVVATLSEAVAWLENRVRPTSKKLDRFK